MALSFLIFTIFKVPKSRDYFYNLGGKEFIVSKIGNSGVQPAVKLFGVAFSAVACNEIGRSIDRSSNKIEATEVYEPIIGKSEDHPHMTNSERTAALNQASTEF